MSLSTYFKTFEKVMSLPDVEFRECLAKDARLILQCVSDILSSEEARPPFRNLIGRITTTCPEALKEIQSQDSSKEIELVFGHEYPVIVKAHLPFAAVNSKVVKLASWRGPENNEPSFFTQEKTLVFEDIEASEVLSQELIHYWYTSEIEITRHNLDFLWQVSILLHDKDLARKCEHWLIENYESLPEDRIKRESLFGSDLKAMTRSYSHAREVFGIPPNPHAHPLYRMGGENGSLLEHLEWFLSHNANTKIPESLSLTILPTASITYEKTKSIFIKMLKLLDGRPFKLALTKWPFYEEFQEEGFFESIKRGVFPTLTESVTCRVIHLTLPENQNLGSLVLKNLPPDLESLYGTIQSEDIEHLSTLRSLSYLNLHLDGPLTDSQRDVFRSFLKNNSRLKTVSLAHTVNGKSTPWLPILKPTSEGEFSWGKGIERLDNLTLFTDDTIKCFPHLKTVSVHMSHSQIEHLLFLENLHEIEWTIDQSFFGEGLKNLAQLRKLKRTKLRYLEESSVTKDAIQAMASIPYLEEIDLKNSSISSNTLEALSSCKYLKKLRLDHCDFKNDITSILPHIPSLEELFIENPCFSWAAINTAPEQTSTELPSFAKLKKIVLITSRYSSTFKDSDFELLKRSPNLEEVAIKGAKLPGQFLDEAIPNLRKLSLKDCSGQDNQSLKFIEKALRLRQLELENITSRMPKIDHLLANEVFELNILKIPSLVEVQISRVHLQRQTFSDAAHKLSFSNLILPEIDDFESFPLSPELTHLSILGLKKTNSLWQLKNAPILKYLRLSNLVLDDETVAQLPTLKHLLSLSIRWYCLSDKGVKMLKKKLPALRMLSSLTSLDSFPNRLTTPSELSPSNDSDFRALQQYKRSINSPSSISKEIVSTTQSDEDFLTDLFSEPVHSSDSDLTAVDPSSEFSSQDHTRLETASSPSLRLFKWMQGIYTSLRSTLRKFLQ